MSRRRRAGVLLVVGGRGACDPYALALRRDWREQAGQPGAVVVVEGTERRR